MSPPDETFKAGLRLSTQQLRWRCAPKDLPYASTADVAAAEGIVGQARAVEALRFGLEITAPGQNVFVRGMTGTGRLTLVRRILDDVQPGIPLGSDYAYVRRFDQPDRPRLLRLPRGRGEAFRDRILELSEFIASDLPAVLDSDGSRRERVRIEAEAAVASESVTDPLEAEFAQVGLALVFAQSQSGPRPMIVPLVEGKPVNAEQLADAKQRGAITEEELAARQEAAEEARPKLEAALLALNKVRLGVRDGLRSLARGEATRALEEHLQDVRAAHPGEDVAAFLDDVVHDVAWHRLADLEGDQEFSRLYDVNLVVSHQGDEPAPVIIENAPTVQTLVGTVDSTTDGEGKRYADHMSVRVGSLVRVDGGVLIVEARELLSQPGAWAALVRTLRTGLVDMIAPETPLPWMAPALTPDPIAVQFKVVLIGEAEIYYLLDARDPDFPNLFKVLADFDDTLARDASGLAMYGAVLAGLVARENLPHFDAGAVAELVEHGARIAAERGRLTARFGRLADLVREAAFLARKGDVECVTFEHVRDAVRRTKRRADGPARRRRERIAAGDIRIAVEGEQVGQVNGLAVLSAGPLTYGVPTRITATVAPGAGGTVNIERESQLSGAIHTKAFYILGGLLRRLLPVEFPLTFAASIAFEQSYGGIDGDSASGAEICCLLSALTELPVQQRLAMTGAIDQMGNILQIGAVNEKIEGFYDTCAARGPLQGQGVLIPRSNVGDLMLRHDVVMACDRGEFFVYGVDNIREAIALIFDLEAGEVDAEHRYPDGTVLAIAMQRARTLFDRARGTA